MALDNRYRRRIVTFSTELEGLIPSYGDLISITHDMPHWGSGGEILSKNGMTLTISEPVEFEEGQTHYLALRKKNGSLSGPFVVTPGALPTIGWILCYGILFIINIPHPLTLFGTAFGVIFAITTISQLCGCPVFLASQTWTQEYLLMGLGIVLDVSGARDIGLKERQKQDVGQNNKPLE